LVHGARKKEACRGENAKGSAPMTTRRLKATTGGLVLQTKQPERTFWGRKFGGGPVENCWFGGGQNCNDHNDQTVWHGDCAKKKKRKRVKKKKSRTRVPSKVTGR